jgi:hypothetical protein
MAVNLIRNARVFYTSNVDTATGAVNTTGFTVDNTREIQVLDGLSFSQNTTSDVVTLNEAGTTPDRGQRSFNTALDPVDFSFSTYIRPKFSSNYVLAEEAVLWNAFACAIEAGPYGTTAAPTGAAWVETTGAAGTALSTLSFANSDKNQLLKFGMIILLDSAAYVIDNCALDTATVDFGLDAIAMIAWTGKGTALRSITATAGTTGNPVFSGGTISGTALAKTTNAPYLANKLSVLSLNSGFSGGTQYNLALTGGSLTISNNLTYLTPANLGIVNQPCTYFTGTRAISGTVNAYLKSGTTGDAANLLSAMLTSSTTDVAPVFRMAVSVGGSSGNYVKFDMPAAVLTIPTVNTEQVVSTAINFTAHGSSSGALDILAENELSVIYNAIS